MAMHTQNLRQDPRASLLITQPDVSGEHLDLAERPSLADANAVEGPHDRVGQSVLFPCGTGEVFHRELLEAVRRKGRRDLPFVPFPGRPVVSALVHHRGTDIGHLLQRAGLVRQQRGITTRRHDPLVGGEKVVGIGMEVRNPADHRRPRDEVIAVFQQIGQQAGIARVALDEVVIRVIVEAVLHRPVLGEVVDADHSVAPVEQLLHYVAADEAGRAGDKNLRHEQSSVSVLVFGHSYSGAVQRTGAGVCASSPRRAVSFSRRAVSFSMVSRRPKANRYQCR